ncbi:lysozyme inhibitor LprI family protein [Phenylobacterium sp. Root700]|uniref:lysozyme inhibitor LprI family protein n=1 Tax=Phenylobacterium sp. Root700 TaxID=1736591 RepID=UPI0007018E6C|nr:lysozyme inhibitor LprI family protein [Phenylobacterium sp. Root700]KRB40696.1 hypothetical protein ASE02_08370 [Phenylobacterium sp. Root700]
MTFDGGDEPPLTLARDDVRETSPRLGRKALIGGIALACVLGVGLGLAARLQLAANVPKPAAMAPSPKTVERQMDIVMAEPQPQALAPKSTPLEVMSPELTQAAKAATPPREPVAEPQYVEASPSYDCREASSPAEEMVCSDPALAAADRHLARAFQRAVKAGAPYDLLRTEQDDWLEIREDAARHSPRAVAAIYDQRIGQLNAMARGEGPDW